MSSENYEVQTSAVLADFKEEIFSKVSDVSAVSDILEKIQEWTSEQLFMTNLLCHYVIKYSSEIIEGKEAAIVDRIVYQKIVDDWESNAAAAHLKEIRDGILNYARRDSLLLLYIQILQRGSISVDHSRSQKALLQSGLVADRNDKLKVANKIYASVFDLAWVEQQLPGITRPVAIVSPMSEASRARPSSQLYPKIAVAVLCLAVLAAAVATYIREPESSAIATPNLPGSAEPTARPQPSDTDESGSIYIEYKTLFDNGMNHGENGRWLPMLRDFCSISKSSTYFAPAEKQLEQWVGLYQEDIQLAHNTVIYEKNGSCPIVDEALEAAINQNPF